MMLRSVGKYLALVIRLRVRRILTDMVAYLGFPTRRKGIGLDVGIPCTMMPNLIVGGYSDTS